MASTTAKQTEVVIACWRGELSTLRSRLELTDPQVARLEKLCRKAGKVWTLDVAPNNSSIVFSALRRKLAGGDGA